MWQVAPTFMWQVGPRIEKTVLRRLGLARIPADDNHHPKHIQAVEQTRLPEPNSDLYINSLWA